MLLVLPFAHEQHILEVNQQLVPTRISFFLLNNNVNIILMITTIINNDSNVIINSIESFNTI